MVVSMISEDFKKAQNTIKRILNDPLVKILSENSSFTKIQLETLLIDIFTEQLVETKLSHGEKTAIRTTDKRISRGSFNRTLQQARKNMIKSIWTILLLGYLKILETPSLSPYLEASNRLEEYLRAYENSKNKSLKDPNLQKNRENLFFFKNDLKNILLELISPRNKERSP